MTSVGIGIIGCGGFACRYHLPALLSMPRVSVKWICEIAPTEILRQTARSSNIQLIDDPAEIYADKDCQAIVISVPHTLHYRYARDAIRLRRHVLVDKPLTTRTTEARELAEAADRAGVVAAVAFNRRLDPGCIRAREIIASGGIGEVVHVSGFQFGYQSGWVLNPELGGGGVFWGRGIHLADLMPWLTGGTPIRVRGQVCASSGDRVDYGGTMDIVFDAFDGQIVCKEKGWHGWDELRVFGNQGVIDLLRPRAREHGWEMRWQCQGSSSVERVLPEEAMGAATKDFINAVTTGSRPACTFAAAVQSIALVETAFRSAGQGGAWLQLPN